MKQVYSIPHIPEDEKTPIVQELLLLLESVFEIVQQKSETIQLKSEIIQQLKDEIARLKNQKPKPKIKPSKLGKPGGNKPEEDKNKSTNEDEEKPSNDNAEESTNSPEDKRPGSKKRDKTAELIIHETIPLEPDYIPPGSVFNTYNDFVVQGIKFEPYNICYRRKVYKTLDGNFISAELPEYLNDGHFSPELHSFIIYQYHQCRVTQPLILEELLDIGIDISSGQINNILTEDKDIFHKEKNGILKTGLEVSPYVNVDDTSARHDGINGYCTHIGNEYFAWFESTDSKSRINFLQLLRAGQPGYIINDDAIAYMKENKLPKPVLEQLTQEIGHVSLTEYDWYDYLAQKGIWTDRHIQIATEGALIGCVIEYGILDNLVIMSDDAGQFNILIHILCWIHAERAINKIIPYTTQAETDLEKVRNQIWELYEDLKKYKENPDPVEKIRIEVTFDDIFTQNTASALLNQALRRIFKNKSELLLVLERPDLPLHNNLSENDIREYVIRTKISGGTRSLKGRRCRDTFTSLKKTCRKLGVSFWKYIQDRVKKENLIPDLSELIRKRVIEPG